MWYYVSRITDVFLVLIVQIVVFLVIAPWRQCDVILASKNYIFREYRGRGGKIHSFVTLATDGGIPVLGSLLYGTEPTGIWVGPRLDVKNCFLIC
jgi:hypothetical protein